MENVRNFNFGKTRFKTLFLKYISSHTHEFCSSISILWGVSKMFLCYFQKLCFLKNSVGLCPLRMIQSIFFRSIESVLRFLKKPLSVLINQNWFSINRNSWIRFFKNQIWLVQTFFSKRVFKLFLSLRIGQG